MRLGDLGRAETLMLLLFSSAVNSSQVVPTILMRTITSASTHHPPMAVSPFSDQEATQVVL
jgi:hypothetical protein